MVSIYARVRESSNRHEDREISRGAIVIFLDLSQTVYWVTVSLTGIYISVPRVQRLRECPAADDKGPKASTKVR